ncbi:hypothetical protein DN069_06330 [Streptacidiphilus pinicola]|uniref:Uncharacterized protein n=1 Tax=Streptacidiphilus pinicola TaxID=2219663 RepID=A0A2X0JFP2_9ACTN|nr:hypothetical protein [Streptacidiphilus pinicola]RAG86428.1 hypothetical protein DN069_06330 [Streptacidiphilus pinicola]
MFMRSTVLAAVAASAVIGVMAPAAQAAPRTVAQVQTGHHHRHCDRGDRWERECRCDRGDRWERECREHGVDAGGGAMAAEVARLSQHIGG